MFWTPQLGVTEGSSSLTNSIYVFDTANVVYVTRQAPQIILDRSQLFSSDQSQLRLTLRGDLMVPQPTAVVRGTGFLP